MRLDEAGNDGDFVLFGGTVGGDDLESRNVNEAQDDGLGAYFCLDLRINVACSPNSLFFRAAREVGVIDKLPLSNCG